MPYLDLNRGQAFYAVARESSDAGGANPPAVLIHGTGGSHLDWPPPFRRMPGRSVYAVDLPGHGRSPTPRPYDAISSYRIWLLDLLQALVLPPAVFVGHSMGAAVALDLARSAPDRVAGMVLIGAGACFPVAPTLLAQAAGDPSVAAKTISDLAYGPGAPEEMKRVACERMGLVAPDVLHGDLIACDRFDVRGRLAEIRVPTLIISGSDDRMTPAGYGRHLHEGLPRSEYVEIQGAGHMLTFERTDEVMAAILGFVGRLGA